MLADRELVVDGQVHVPRHQVQPQLHQRLLHVVLRRHHQGGLPVRAQRIGQRLEEQPVGQAQDVLDGLQHREGGTTGGQGPPVLPVAQGGDGDGDPALLQPL